MSEVYLGEDVLTALDQRLAETDAFLTRAYPGEDGRRQPVHTMYVAADRYTPELPAEWGQIALDIVAEHGGMGALCALVGLDDELIAQVAPRVEAKLVNEPIEDLRLDFEDGYGNRGDTSEDRIQRRLKTARDEWAEAPKFHHQIVNNNLSEAVRELERIIRERFNL